MLSIGQVLKELPTGRTGQSVGCGIGCHGQSEIAREGQAPLQHVRHDETQMAAIETDGREIDYCPNRSGNEESATHLTSPAASGAR